MVSNQAVIAANLLTRLIRTFTTEARVLLESSINGK